MDRIIATAMAAVMVCSACSTSDGDDMAGLRLELQQLPMQTQAQARRSEANRRAYKALEKHDNDERIMEVMCEEYGPGEDATPLLWTTSYTVNDFAICLLQLDNGAPRTYRECIQKLLADGVQRYRELGGKGECTDGWHEGWGEVGEPIVDPEWDPDTVTMDDVAEGLVASDVPPVWIAGLIVVTAAGVLVLAPEFLPALCLLSEKRDHWSCPGSPFYPPGQTPQPEPGDEGDR